MKYIDTICINCEMSNNGWEIAQLNSSHVIRLDQNNYHAYAIFVGVIGEVFYTAQQLQSEGILDRPYKVAIVIPKIETYKDNPEDNLTRIKFICNQFVPPEKGIAITFYEHWQEKKIMRPWQVHHVWPYKDQWNKDNTEDYIALQTISKLKENYFHPGIDAIYDRIINVLNDLGIEYKMVGYEQTIDEMFTTLLKCKLLISPTSCAYYIAGGLNLPTLACGDIYYAQTDKTMMKKIKDSDEIKPVLVTAWGHARLNFTKLIHYDIIKGLDNRPQSNTINIGKVETERDFEILRKKLLE